MWSYPPTDGVSSGPLTAMPKTKPKVAFRATLKSERGSADIALIEVPGDVRAVFGKA